MSAVVIVVRTRNVQIFKRYILSCPELSPHTVNTRSAGDNADSGGGDAALPLTGGVNEVSSGSSV